MDERIDIEVTDKVAKTIKTELLGISAAAKSAHPEINKLKAALSGMKFSGMASFRKMASDANALTVATTKLDGAQTKAALSAQRLALAEAKTALAQEKVRTQAARTAEIETRSYLANERALNQAVVAEHSAAAAKDRTAAASMKAAAAAEREADAAHKVQRAYEAEARAAAAQSRYNSSAGIGRAPKSARDSFAVFEDHGVLDKTNAGIKDIGKNAGLARNHLLNLGFQLQDIFVSLASGQKPLTVFIQQGGQIGQIAAQSGVGLGGMAKAIGGIAMRFAPVLLVVGAATAAFGVFKHAVGDVDTKKLVNELGLTAKEIKQLENTTVSVADVIKATFQEMAAGIGIDLSNVKKYFASAMDFLTLWGRRTLAGIYTMFLGTFKAVASIVSDAFSGKSAKEILANAGKAYTDTYTEIDNNLIKAGERIRKRIADNKRTELAAQAAEIKANRSGGRNGKSEAERLAERQAEALRKLRAELGKEQAMLARNLVGIDATIAERMNSIADSLEGVKIDVFAEQNRKLREEIEGVVDANERAKLSLGVLSSIYDSAVKPANDWAIAQEQAAKAMEIWGQEEAVADLINKWLAEQKEGFLDATNPMRQYNKALADQRELLKFHGRELEIQTEIQRRYNEMKALDPSSNPNKASIGSSVRDDMRRQGIQGFLSDIDSAANDNFREGGNQWIIDNYRTLYDEIARIRQGDLRSEAEIARQKQELNLRYAEARVSDTREMFSQLAGLQNSSIREFAAIGKAAAIAQATIDGILAVQKALAQGGPLGIGMAITTGVMAAANVARIAGIGFQKGGYTGDVPPHQVAGAVHGREYVMDAAATARIGVPTLEALRNGRLNPAPAANNNAPRVTVINNAGAAVEVRERSDGELEIMVEAAIERKMGPTLERRMSNPNSKESRSISNNFKVRRNR